MQMHEGGYRDTATSHDDVFFSGLSAGIGLVVLAAPLALCAGPREALRDARAVAAAVPPATCARRRGRVRCERRRVVTHDEPNAALVSEV